MVGRLLLLLGFLFSTALTTRQLAVAAAASSSSSKVVTSLPGFHGRLPFHLETGYVEVDEDNGTELFYYFVESEASTGDAPFLLWLTGGDHCTVFSGLAFEIGPVKFIVEPYNGTIPSLEINPNSWTKLANILFVDTPVGAGFSFSRRPQGYHVGEVSTSLQLHEFLIKWISDHPKFLSSPLYIGGDSYAGKIVPFIAQKISEGNEVGRRPLLNLKIMARAVAPLNFNAFLEKAKLKDDGSNFVDWARNLRIILTASQKAYVLDAPLGDPPAPVESVDVVNAWQARSDDYSIVQCALLYGLEPGLQRCFERHGAYEMFQELKFIFKKNARIERYEISDKFYACKMEENGSVSDHILRMSGYSTRLAELGMPLPPEAITDRVLQSLPPSYKSFVLNYNMHGMNKSVAELFAMLKAAESEIQKEHQVLMVNKTTSFKKNGKGKKGKSKKDGKAVATPVKKPKAGPKPETQCFHCKGTGHWKRNCPKYLADKKAANNKQAGTAE